VTPDHPGDVVQRPRRQIDGCTMEQHPRPLVVTDPVVVINPSTRGFLRRQANTKLAIVL
jgi:P pilus assembly chaperone PapD